MAANIGLNRENVILDHNLEVKQTFVFVFVFLKKELHIRSLHGLTTYEPRHDKTCPWAPTRSDTNPAAQPKKRARDSKFRI